VLIYQFTNRFRVVSFFALTHCLARRYWPAAQVRVASLELFCFAATVDARLRGRIARRELGLVSLLVAALPPFASTSGNGSASGTSGSDGSALSATNAGGGGANDDANSSASTNAASAICARTAAGTNRTHAIDDMISMNIRCTFHRPDIDDWPHR
jgi:hypothetical protein